MNSNDLVTYKEGGKIMGGGFEIHSNLIQKNCPALVSYMSKNNRRYALPFGLAVQKENTQKHSFQTAGGGGIISNKQYDKLLNNAKLTTKTQSLKTRKNKKAKTRKNKTRRT